MKRADKIRSKILGWQQIAGKISEWHSEGKRIVFTNGCFDILHYGHIDYLSGAADLGDILIIGLNSDSSVRTLKGDERPVNNQETRSFVLAAMEFVDAVVIFDQQTPFELIKTIKPDVLVKGGDYKAESVVGFDIVKENGGEVVILPFVVGYSTSNLIKKIRQPS